MSRQNRVPENLRVDSSASHYTSERASMSPSFSLASVPAVSPEPAYIAAAAASNVVAGEIAHEFHVELVEGASVSLGSLFLINTFLDRLLFNFLSCARSTSLSALRTAVTEVLRPRLAKEAIAGADEELEEYLGGDPDEMDAINGEKSDGPWDLDVAWKRTRLRCMIYTRLGDMEEDEEEMFLKQYNLMGTGDQDSGIQPAVAIFLTSVLEFIGEHCLMIAAQAAYKRHETRARIENMSFRRITVEEADMEKNAINSTLGRLWRSWRASLRSPRGSLSRVPGMAARGFRGFSVSSRSSITTESHPMEEPEKVESVETVRESPDPSTIALPTTIYDIDEIEVPGFSAEYAQRSRKVYERLRPESMFVHPRAYTYEGDNEDDESNDDGTEEADTESEAATPTVSQFKRPRALSLPNPEVLFFVPSITPSDASYTTTPEELPKSEELKPQTNPIIDMAGNSAAVIVDYAIPKSNSAPTSPYGGSMLNAIAVSAARQPTAEQSFLLEEDPDQDQDPADGVLQFDRNDYEIGEHEHSNLGSRVSTVEPMKNLQKPFDEYPMPAVSPLVGPTDNAPSGAVSPLEAEFPRAEVSPILDSEDEEYSRQQRQTDVKKVHTPASQLTTHSIASITTPIVATTAGAAAVGAVAAAAITHTRHAEPVEQQQEQQQQEQQQQQQQQPSEIVVMHRANQGRQRSREGPTSQDYTKEDNRETFVLPQDLDLTQPPEEIRRSVPDTEQRRWRPSDKGTISTNLPPVRESIEKPPVSPVSPEPLSPSRHGQVSRKAVPPAKPTSTSPQQRQMINTAINTAVDVEPISGQRMVISPVSAKDPMSGSRPLDNARNSSSGKQSSAKNKNRVGSLSNDARDSIPSRSSSEGQKSLNHDRYSRSSTNNSEPHRDFDQLINSGETMKYTLTSQSMREIEERGREPIQMAPTTVQYRNAAIDQNRPNPPAPSNQTPSPQSMNGLRSNPISEAPAAPFVVHAGLPVKRGPQLIAKDARMERDNTSELKEFFRSTGPESVSAIPNPMNKRLSGPIPRAPKVGLKGERYAGMESGKRQPASPNSNRTGSMKARPKFEPREATRSQDNTALLAEFFRQGPPGSSRSPMKAGFDENGGRFRDAPSVASTQDSLVTKSVQSSVNSRVGLLDSTRTQNNSMKPSQPWEKRGPSEFEDSMAPVRKQHRVRDPYAIDDSEEDDEMGTPKNTQDNEESLLDFLRNAEPPAELSASPPRRSNGPSKEANKKPVLKSRFGSTSRKAPAEGPIGVPRIVANPASLAQSSKAISPTVKTYPPSQGNTYSESRQSQANSSARAYAADEFGRPGRRMSANGVRQARKQARSGTEDSTSVRDLADFLRNTEPPPSAFTQAPLPPTPDREESSGFSRMFSRRKKGVIV